VDLRQTDGRRLYPGHQVSRHPDSLCRPSESLTRHRVVSRTYGILYEFPGSSGTHPESINRRIGTNTTCLIQRPTRLRNVGQTLNREALCSLHLSHILPRRRDQNVHGTKATTTTPKTRLLVVRVPTSERACSIRNTVEVFIIMLTRRSYCPRILHVATKHVILPRSPSQ
jgi:hypothetical protein